MKILYIYIYINRIPAFCFNKKSTKKSGFIKPKSEGVVESGFTFQTPKEWKGSVLYALSDPCDQFEGCCWKSLASESVFIISTLQVWQRCWNQMQLLILAISSDSQVEKKTTSNHYLFFRWLNFNRLKCKTSTTYTVENTPQDFTINSCHHSSSETGFFIHDTTIGASTLLNIVLHSACRKINANLILRL